MDTTKVLFDKVVYAVKSGDKALMTDIIIELQAEYALLGMKYTAAMEAMTQVASAVVAHIEDRMRSPIFHLKRPTASAEFLRDAVLTPIDTGLTKIQRLSGPDDSEGADEPEGVRQELPLNTQRTFLVFLN